MLATRLLVMPLVFLATTMMAVSLTGSAQASESWLGVGSVNATVNVGSSPNAAAISPDATTVWVANYDSNNVSIINAVTQTNSGLIPVGLGPWDLAMSPDGAQLWVVNITHGSVSVIDTSTQVVVRTIAVGSMPYALAFSPSGSEVWVVNNVSDSISVIDRFTYVVTSTIPLPASASPTEITFTPDGTKAWVTDVADVAMEDRGAIVIVDVTSKTVSGSPIAVSGFPNQIAFSPDGSRAWVTTSNSFTGTVTVIDTATRTILGSPISTGVGSVPVGVTISPNGSRVWVSGNTSVIVIDPVTSTVVGQIPAGLRASFMAISPNATRLYVPNRGSDTLSIIDTNLSPDAPPSSEPTAPIQEFGVPAGTQADTCANLAPPNIDWPGIAHLRNSGWSISFSDWPNNGRGGWVCVRQPYWIGNGWSVR